MFGSRTSIRNVDPSVPELDVLDSTRLVPFEVDKTSDDTEVPDNIVDRPSFESFCTTYLFED